MKIQSIVYDYILKKAERIPYESGGIIGMQDDVITVCLPDAGLGQGSMGHYEPDTGLLNDTIARWQSGSIEFCGIYHSHFVSKPQLSKGDVQYVNEIMNSFDGDGKLLFPLVLVKEKKIVFFEAEKTNDEINITQVDVEII